jgi:hypothetical protein
LLAYRKEYVVLFLLKEKTLGHALSIAAGFSSWAFPKIGIKKLKSRI